MKNNYILIVEDEVLVALRLKLGVEKKGYKVTHSIISGEEAVVKAKKLKPNKLLKE